MKLVTNTFLSIFSTAEKLEAMNETVKALSQTVEALNGGVEKKLDLINQPNAALSARVQAISQRLETLEKEVVITRGMRSLPAVTVCFWMKTADAGKEGTPLSYAVSGRAWKVRGFAQQEWLIQASHHPQDQ